MNERPWEKLVGEGRLVDFGRYAGTNTITYAFAVIQSEAEQTGLLFAGADDGAQIWLNGREILKQAKLPTKTLEKVTDGVKVPITLQQGANPIMVKLLNTYGGMGLSLIAGNEDGDTLPGVSYALTLPVTAVEEEVGRQIPERFVLRQNFPNPFNQETTIPYVLPGTVEVRLEVYNLSGQVIRTLVNGVVPAGDHLVRWDGRDDTGRDVASGTYLARLQTKDVVRTTKMLLIR
ncbi:MAG: T9SS type A sorting domain-containing protein [Candidatus Latescibacteria bacterium]|nr:T9SS type A sorting domain-containing protein [Candidatus Latescibacterota bacterium]